MTDDDRTEKNGGREALVALNVGLTARCPVHLDEPIGIETMACADCGLRMMRRTLLERARLKHERNRP